MSVMLLEQLRQEGEARRNELTGMVSSLKSQSAKQAAQTVLIASQVDFLQPAVHQGTGNRQRPGQQRPAEHWWFGRTCSFRTCSVRSLRWQHVCRRKHGTGHLEW